MGIIMMNAVERNKLTGMKKKGKIYRGFIP
jgi:hypothetical protein